MDAIDNLLTRGVDKIYPSREPLEKVLRSGKKLRLYQGFDPSGAHLHIGHAVAMRKLRQFQELGHQVIFLIGDFTGMIGDPTGKQTARKRLSREEVLINAKAYKEQANKILRFDGENPVEIKFNNDWLSKLTFADVLELTSQFSVQQMIERDMFQQRLKNNQEISLVEFLYPVMVAYDAIAMSVDLELGGSDQTFNMLAGRRLHERTLHKEKFVMTVPLLTDAKGTKIGKTEDNVIGITDPPNELYGKIMALGDEAIVNCFTLLTDTPLEKIDTMQKKMDKGEENPMVFKKRLAFELTKQFNNDQAAQAAQAEFERVHQKGTSFSATAVSVSARRVIDALIQTKVSKSEAKRLIEQEAIDLNDKTIHNDMEVNDGDIIRIGKKKFIKII
jgi:tyrosyl-tRNA synthetase